MIQQVSYNANAPQRMIATEYLYTKHKVLVNVCQYDGVASFLVRGLLFN
jgi:hypothetical protein